MNSMIFEEITQSDPVSFAFITLPIKHCRAVPPSGCIDIPEYTFNKVFDQFKVRLIDYFVYRFLFFISILCSFLVYFITNIKISYCCIKNCSNRM